MCSITAGEVAPDIEEASTGDEFEFKAENDDPESGLRDIHDNRILCAEGVGGRGNVEVLVFSGGQRLVLTGERSPSRVLVDAGSPHAFEVESELSHEWADLLGERRLKKPRFGHAGLNKRLLDGVDARVSCTTGGVRSSGISYSRRLANIALRMESLDASKELSTARSSR
jgi:hypothetical protein